MKPALPFNRRPLRPLAVAQLVAITLLAGPLPATAYMDHGGRISRDFAKGTLHWGTGSGADSEEIVLFTWAGDGTQSERLTIFAFCASGTCPAGVPTPQAPGSKCIDPTADPAAPAWSDHCEGQEGCLWGWELPHSRGDLSYAPPVVSQVGTETLEADRVFVATRNDGGGGSVWSFDLDGTCHWSAKFDNKQAKSGFYARPAVQELGDPDDPSEGRVIFAPSLNNSKMHVLFDGEKDDERSGRSWGYNGPAVPGEAPQYDMPPIRIAQPGSSGGRVRFGPIVECDPADCKIPEVLVGAENGNSKRGLYKFWVCPQSLDHCQYAGQPASSETACAAKEQNDSWWGRYHLTDPKCKAQDGYRLIWDIRDPALPMKIGGEIVGDAVQRYLVGNLDNLAGVAVYDITRAEGLAETLAGSGGLDLYNPPDEPAHCEEDCFAIHEREDGQQVVQGAHRSHPTAVFELDACDPGAFPSTTRCTCASGDTDCAWTVYISQKEGAPSTGAQLWKFRMNAEGTDSIPVWNAGDSNKEKWDAIFTEAWGTVGPDIEPWPTCLGGGGASAIPTTSWSSPAVHPDGRSVFVSSRQGANGAGGIYRIPLTAGGACPDEDGDALPDRLLDFLPTDGWRTTGIFSELQEQAGGVPGPHTLIHYGSSQD